MVYNYLKTLEGYAELGDEPSDLEFSTDNLLLLDPIGDQLDDLLLEQPSTVSSTVMVPPHSTINSEPTLKNRTVKLSSQSKENLHEPSSDGAEGQQHSSDEQDVAKTPGKNKEVNNDRARKEKAVDVIVQKLKEKSEKQKRQGHEIPPEEKKRQEEEKNQKKEELKRIAEEKRQEEKNRKKEELKQVEGEKRQEKEKNRKKEELKRKEEEKRLEEEKNRKKEGLKRIEEKRQEEEKNRKKEELKRVEEEKRQEEKNRKKEEQKRIGEEKRQEEEKNRKKEELKRVEEEKRQEEKNRKKEELKRIGEEKRQEEEKNRKKEELKRVEEEKRQEEKNRKKEELKRIEEEKRQEEKNRKEEELKRIEEEKRQEEETNRKKEELNSTNEQEHQEGSATILEEKRPTADLNPMGDAKKQQDEKEQERSALEERIEWFGKQRLVEAQGGYEELATQTDEIRNLVEKSHGGKLFNPESSSNKSTFAVKIRNKITSFVRRMTVNKSFGKKGQVKMGPATEPTGLVTGSSSKDALEAVSSDPSMGVTLSTAPSIPSAERIYIGITHLLRWIRFQADRMISMSEEEIFTLAQEELYVLGLEEQQITGPIHLLIKFRLLGPNYNYELLKEKNKWRSLVILLGIWLSDHHENGILPSDDKEIVQLAQEEKVFQCVTPRTLLSILCTWRHIMAFQDLIRDDPSRKNGLILNPHVKGRTTSLPVLYTSPDVKETKKAKKFKSMEQLCE